MKWLLCARYANFVKFSATRTLRAGNLKIVQQMLGHEDIAITAKYAHAMIDNMRAAMEAANRTESHTDVAKKPAKQLKKK